MKKLNINGFHVIWLTFVLAILLVGGAGYYLYQRNGNKEDVSQNNQANTEELYIQPTDNIAVNELVSWGYSNSCISKSKSEDPLAQTEEEFAKSIVLNQANNRAKVRCGSGAHYLGKNVGGVWIELFVSSAPLASAIVEACKLDELVSSLLVDDNYAGGKGTKEYEANVSSTVKICKDFAVKNG